MGTDHVWRTGGTTELRRQHLLGTTRDQQQAIELFLEAMRLAVAPQAPSRFDAVFAMATLEDAETFAAAFRPNESTSILRVDGSCGHRGDIELLTGFGIPGERSLAHARAYWEGARVGGLVECLLVPPVRVLERVR